MQHSEYVSITCCSSDDDSRTRPTTLGIPVPTPGQVYITQVCPSRRAMQESVIALQHLIAAL